MTTRDPALRLAISDEVSDAIASGHGIVALESTIISHGLPTATSAATARQIEDAVRRGGAVPATVAVVDGTVRVGLTDDALVRVAEDEGVVKTSVRDLGPVVARGLTGATTVAATAYVARLAGLRVFATGGLGGVHRGARVTWDESADLAALAAAPVTVVCAGVKSILDVAATLERLETLSVPVLGYRTDAMPGFYVRDAGLPVPWRVESAGDAAEEMDLGLHERTLAEGLAEAGRRGTSGKDVTPFLLGWFHERTDGASLAANVALVLANAGLAAEIAADFAKE